MRAHYFQHVPFEGLGAIEPWLIENNFKISHTQFYKKPVLPDINDIDCLIVMGGPMSVKDEEDFPWLISEKQFIRECIAQQKKVVGICLGAQLIASAMGYNVYKNEVKEIGWFPIQFNTQFELTQTIQAPEEIVVFHWHGETFDLPEGAALLAASKNCPHQIFALGKNIIGFQCHLETTEKSLDAIIENCINEITDAPYIQSVVEMKRQYPLNAPHMQALLYRILNACLLK